MSHKITICCITCREPMIQLYSHERLTSERNPDGAWVFTDNRAKTWLYNGDKLVLACCSTDHARQVKVDSMTGEMLAVDPRHGKQRPLASKIPVGIRASRVGT